MNHMTHQPDGASGTRHPGPAEPRSTFRLEQKLLVRLVGALAITIGGAVIGSIAAAHGHLLWMTMVAAFSCAVAMVTNGTIFIQYARRHFTPRLLGVDILVGLAAVVDAVILATPLMWR